MLILFTFLIVCAYRVLP